MRADRVEFDDLDVQRIKQYLKRSSLPQYYEYAKKILETLLERTTNEKSSNDPFPHHLKEKLSDMFRLIQDPHEIARKDLYPQQPTFLCYSFILHKFFHLLGEKDLAARFPLTKQVERLSRQEQLWKHVCGQLNWEYSAE